MIVSFEFDADLIGRFVELPWRIYRGDGNWTPPSRDVVRAQLSESHPFYRHGRSRKFIACDESGDVCGRVAAIVNDNFDSQDVGIGHVGFFECVDRFDVASALLDRAFDYLRQNGVAKVWGPLNYATLYSYRFLTKGFDRPAFYTDIYNPPYYPEYFKAYGFRELRTYYSDIVEAQPGDLAGLERTYGYARQRLARAGFTTRPVDMENFESEIVLLYDLVSEIFKDNFAFSGMEYDEFRRIYMPYEKLLNPENLLFSYDPKGRPIGFFLSYPDFSNRYPRTYVGKMLGVLPQYKRYGVGSGLLHDAMLTYLRDGYERCIASLRIEGNPSLKFGAQLYRPFKEYVLYEYDLTRDGRPGARR